MIPQQKRIRFLSLFSEAVFRLSVPLLLIFVFLPEVSAQGFKSVRRTSGFSVPKQLRGRVDFWIDVFTKYGKYQVVLHHRNYPQARYAVLDMRLEAQVLSPGKFDAYKKKAIAVETKDIESAIRWIASGKAPRSDLQKRVQAALAQVPGGSSKYKDALEKDMIRSQTGIREKYAEALQRSGRYMHLIHQVFVKEHGLPIELTRLPFIESSFDYTAYSSVGAAGIWQFMPRTARGFGMKVGSVIDERRDVFIATKGAAKYLKSAYKSLQDWPLALTSYNHGVAGVRRKVKMHGTSDIIELIENPKIQAFGFASANFWPEFLAALEVYDNYQKYFPGLRLDSPRYYSTYTMPSSMSVDYVSKKLNIPTEVLKEYNYALAPAVWKGRYRIPKGYSLHVPKNIGVNTSTLRSPEPQPQTSSIYGGVRYKVRRGDTLSAIARKFGVSISRIKALNNLHSDLVNIGQILVVKEAEARSKNTVVASSSAAIHSYKVRPGDTLSDIAQRNGMTVSQLMERNGLRSSRIRVGQVLKVAGGISSSTGGGQTSAASSYTVKSGDTLTSIAKKHGTSVSEIMRINGLGSSIISIGQVLKLNGNAATAISARKVKSYVIQRGDTLWAVSKKFGVSVAKLKKANNLRGSSLYVGQKLRIP